MYTLCACVTRTCRNFLCVISQCTRMSCPSLLVRSAAAPSTAPLWHPPRRTRQWLRRESGTGNLANRSSLCSVCPPYMTTLSATIATFSSASRLTIPVRFVVLCCAVLACAVLCCAVLCCAVLCCAVLCIENIELTFQPSSFSSPSLPPPPSPLPRLQGPLPPTAKPASPSLARGSKRATRHQ